MDGEVLSCLRQNPHDIQLFKEYFIYSFIWLPQILVATCDL